MRPELCDASKLLVTMVSLLRRGLVHTDGELGGKTTAVVITSAICRDSFAKRYIIQANNVGH